MIKRAARAARVVAYILLVGSFCLGTLYVVSSPRRASGYLSQAADYGRQLLVPPADGHVDSSALEDIGKVTQDVLEQDLDKLRYIPLALKEHCEGYLRGHRRFGFGAPAKNVDQYDVSLLRAGWYHTFWFQENPPIPEGMEYAQTIRLCQENSWTLPSGRTCASEYTPSQEAIEDYAAAHPGILWIIGNEPDAPIQDCITPDFYAEKYHELYGIIKGADPTAKVAIAGVVQATPLRLQYLDMILEEYEICCGGMIPVDVWNVHGFILQELAGSWGCQIPCGLSAQQGMLYGIDDHDNMTIFKQQIVAFRQWMKDHGERNKPLIVTEYGILFPDDHGYDLPRVLNFMLATFDYLITASDPSIGYPGDCNRLVQAWAWYSLDDDHFEKPWYDSFSHLFDPDTEQITNLGIAYGNYTSALP